MADYKDVPLRDEGDWFADDPESAVSEIIARMDAQRESLPGWEETPSMQAPLELDSGLLDEAASTVAEFIAPSPLDAAVAPDAPFAELPPASEAPDAEDSPFLAQPVIAMPGFPEGPVPAASAEVLGFEQTFVDAGQPLMPELPAMGELPLPGAMPEMDSPPQIPVSEFRDPAKQEWQPGGEFDDMTSGNGLIRPASVAAAEPVEVIPTDPMVALPPLQPPPPEYGFDIAKDVHWEDLHRFPSGRTDYFREEKNENLRLHVELFTALQDTVEAQNRAIQSAVDVMRRHHIQAEAVEAYAERVRDLYV